MSHEFRLALRVLRPVAAFVAFELAFLGCRDASAPRVDSGDGSALSFCQRECSARAAIGCLETDFAGRCEAVCEHAVDAGIYRSCTSCSRYLGTDGEMHIRCGS